MALKYLLCLLAAAGNDQGHGSEGGKKKPGKGDIFNNVVNVGFLWSMLGLPMPGGGHGDAAVVESVLNSDLLITNGNVMFDKIAGAIASGDAGVMEFYTNEYSRMMHMVESRINNVVAAQERIAEAYKNLADGKVDAAVNEAIAEKLKILGPYLLEQANSQAAMELSKAIMEKYEEFFEEGIGLATDKIKEFLELKNKKWDEVLEAKLKALAEITQLEGDKFNLYMAQAQKNFAALQKAYLNFLKMDEANKDKVTQKFFALKHEFDEDMARVMQLIRTNDEMFMKLMQVKSAFLQESMDRIDNIYNLSSQHGQEQFMAFLAAINESTLEKWKLHHDSMNDINSANLEMIREQQRLDQELRLQQLEAQNNADIAASQVDGVIKLADIYAENLARQKEIEKKAEARKREHNLAIMNATAAAAAAKAKNPNDSEYPPESKNPPDSKDPPDTETRHRPDPESVTHESPFPGGPRGIPPRSTWALETNDTDELALATTASAGTPFISACAGIAMWILF